MLKVIERLPEGLLGLEAREVGSLLPQPTLIHLPGRRKSPLFVSVLLHGNEESGWGAVRRVLGKHLPGKLPRALSLFVGNVDAAREGKRFLPGQRDFNRIWARRDDSIPEVAMALRVVEEMRERKVFASIDIHNNTGRNPHYSCVRELDHRSLNLAALFSRTVVLVTKPDHMQTEAFAALCPSVTVECGKRGLTHGVDHAAEYVGACLHLSSIAAHPVPDRDIELFHTVAVVKVRPGASMAFGEDGADVDFRPDLDRLNFRELQPGTPIGTLRREVGEVLSVRDEEGRDGLAKFFAVNDDRLFTAAPFMPSMLTTEIEAVRQDCLGYLMERLKK